MGVVTALTNLSQESRKEELTCQMNYRSEQTLYC